MESILALFGGALRIQGMRAQKRRRGRPSIPVPIPLLTELRARGFTIRQIQAKTGLTYGTVRRKLTQRAPVDFTYRVFQAAPIKSETAVAKAAV